MTKEINSLGYRVEFDDQLAGLKSFLENRAYSQLLILVDRNTNDHCLPVLQAAIPELVDYDIIEVDPGEENKNIIGNVFEMFPLSFALATADMESTYYFENNKS